MKQNELIPFTFKDTGKTVLIRKVSPMLVFQLSQDFPPPAPPMVEVTYGEAEKVMEPNPADPAFAEALRDYHRDFNLKTQRMMIKRGVSLVFDDDMKAEVRYTENDAVQFDRNIPGGKKSRFYRRHHFVCIHDCQVRGWHRNTNLQILQPSSSCSSGCPFRKIAKTGLSENRYFLFRLKFHTCDC